MSDATIEVLGDRTILRSTYNQDALPDLRKVPGVRWSGQYQVWHGPATSLEVLVDVAAKHWDLDLDPSVEDERARVMRAKRNARSSGSGLVLNLPGGVLYPFQAAGVQFLIDRHGNGLVADEMGLGKTVQALGLAHEVGAETILVLCPASLRLNWAAEAQRWLSLAPDRIAIGGVKAKKRSPLPWRCIEKPSGLPEGCRMLILNYDRLQAWREALCSHPWSLLICDESHYLKNSRSARSQAALAVRSKSRRTVLLSGTPAANGIHDLWHQLHLIDPGTWSGTERGYRGFTARYAGGHQSKWGWQLRPDRAAAKSLKDLGEEIIGTFVARRTKEQVLPDLPAKTRATVQLDVTSMDCSEYVAQLDLLEVLRSTLKASHDEATRMEIQGQILGGMGQLREILGRAKLDTAIHWCNETLVDEALVVFAYHKSVQAGALAALTLQGRRVGSILGSDSPEDRQTAVDRFQGGELDVLVCSILAAGVGLTLTRASHVVFLERTYRPSDLDQAEDRIHRIGQDRPCWAWYLDATGTLDDTLRDVVEAKRANQSLVLDGREVRTDGSRQAQLQLFELYMRDRPQ